MCVNNYKVVNEKLQNKEKYGNKRNFLHEIPPKRCFGNTDFIAGETVLTSSTLCDSCRKLAARALSLVATSA